MNVVVVPKSFVGYLRRKRSGPEYLRKRAEEKLLELRHSANPESLGEAKKAGLRGCLAIRLNDANRILYSVVRTPTETRIVLLRVCDHKVAYPPELSPLENWLLSPTTQLSELPVSA
jgi:hypothetical protein